MMINGVFANVADRIFDRGAVKFGAFKLKLHEKQPDAPLSPIYLNLRATSHPVNPGPLIGADYSLIAMALWMAIRMNGVRFQALAGLPYAGDPIIAAMDKIAPFDYRTIKLGKEMSESGRMIVPLPGFNYHEGEEVALIDDVVTKAESKLEAIRAIEAGGSVVKHLVVLVDREQGGKAELAAAGYKLVSCFTATELLDHYLATGRITPAKHEECLNYISRS